VILQSVVERELDGAAATERLGAAVAEALAVGEAVMLTGTLGAGKSTLARGLIRALTTPDEDVPSPTFTLVQSYDGRAFPVAHFDLYRLGAPEEADELGLDEALDVGAAVVEWPQRLGARLPPDRLDIDLRVEGEGRVARLTPHGSWHGRSLRL
jgi:tRNA threonylcarbamoyladenosine biosynthesis protein TsaE